MHVRYFLFLVFFLPCIGKAQQINTYKGKTFTFELYLDTSKCTSNNILTPDSVIIKENLTKKKKQVIRLKAGTTLECNSDYVANLFDNMDANFDGNEDMAIFRNKQANNSIAYYWWVYNPVNKMFEEDTLLEKVEGPLFNVKERSITANWSDSNRSGKNIYHYINGKLTLTEQDEFHFDETTQAGTTIVRKLVNGKLTQVQQK